MTKKKAAVAALSIMLLMSALNGVAGAAPSGGKKKSLGTPPVEQTSQITPTIQELLDKETAVPLKTGELKALYINDTKANAMDVMSLSYMPFRFSTASQAALKLKPFGNELLEPAFLPEGYILQEAVISPFIPRFFSPEYKQIRDQLKAKAMASGKKVIFQDLKWSDAESTLTYTREGERLCLKSGPALVLPEDVTVAALPGDQDEVLMINGREVIYTVFGPHHGDLKVQMEWSSADGATDYSLTGNKNNTDTKDELTALVSSMITP